MKQAKTRYLALIPLFSVIISVCGWICVPSAVPFTMQTFGVFFALAYLGGKAGALSILLYIILGSVGLPVFSGGTGGIGILLGANGGFIVGMLAVGIIFWFFEKFAKNLKHREVISLFVGLLCCYFCGALQFYIFWASKGDSVTFFQLLAICILPYLLPDLIKLYLAIFFKKRLDKISF